MALKRRASKSAGAAHKRLAAGVAGKCRPIAAVVRGATEVPLPVRGMMCDTLVKTFGTFKDERHPLQKEFCALVGNVLKGAQGKLQGSINEAQQKKAALEAEAAPAIAADRSAHAVADSASAAMADSKTALADSKAALKDAKSNVHDLEAAAKAAAVEGKATAGKKKDLEALETDYIATVKAGTKHGASFGRHVAKEMGAFMQPELVECVARTFSKSGSAWGTFDNIVDKKVDGALKQAVADLASELGAIAAASEARAASIEAAKGAVVAAEEKVKAMDEVCNNATAASKEADVAAKAAAAGLKTSAPHIHKAADACSHAEEALTSFTNGALAAYHELEARQRPPAPEPEKAEEAANIDAAMAPAPAPAARAAPSILPSPGVLSWVGQMSGLAPSPKIAQTPAIAQSPRR